MKLWHSCFLLSVIFGVCENARIFGMFPMPSISHQVVFRALMLELASRGHDLVVVTPDPVNTTLPNYKQIDIHDVSYEVIHRVLTGKKLSTEEFTKMIIALIVEVSDEQLQTKELKNLINDTSQNFDLCFFESFFHVMFPFKDKFKCSMIKISSLSADTMDLSLIGNPVNPAVYSEMMSTYLHPMTFWERVEETYTYINQWYYDNYVIPELYQTIANKHFGENTRDLTEIGSEVDMMFLNVEPLIYGIRPTVPGIIYMGSMHFKKPKPLPEDLQTLLDNSKQGVIYFSLGSNVKSNKQGDSFKLLFLKVFKNLPYTVVWKFEDDTLKNVPKNVHIRKWLPQHDLLRHKNVKLFITQGGQQSMDEAIDTNIPLIGMPFIADQFRNCKTMIKLGIGKSWDVENLDSKQIKEDIEDVINNLSYKNNVIRLSKLIKDQPQTPMERAVWWTEYVIRNKGAQQLRSPAADVPTYVYLLLDVIAFFALVLLVSLFVIVLIVRILFKVILNIVNRSRGKNKSE